MGGRGAVVGAGHLGRKKPRERRLGWGGVGVCGAVDTALAETGWRKNIQTRRKNGLEIATMFARGEGSKEGKGDSRQRRGGQTGWGKAAGRQGEENRSFGK